MSNRDRIYFVLFLRVKIMERFYFQWIIDYTAGADPDTKPPQHMYYKYWEFYGMYFLNQIAQQLNQIW